MSLIGQKLKLVKEVCGKSTVFGFSSAPRGTFQSFKHLLGKQRLHQMMTNNIEVDDGLSVSCKSNATGKTQQSKL